MRPEPNNNEQGRMSRSVDPSRTTTLVNHQDPRYVPETVATFQVKSYWLDADRAHAFELGEFDVLPVYNRACVAGLQGDAATAVLWLWKLAFAHGLYGRPTGTEESAKLLRRSRVDRRLGQAGQDRERSGAAWADQHVEGEDAVRSHRLREPVKRLCRRNRTGHSLHDLLRDLTWLRRGWSAFG